MGDAGSLMIGFIMIVLGIKLLQSAQGTRFINPVILSLIAVMLVPVLDALRVFGSRAKKGKSPFSADKTHLHHLILDNGLQHKKAALGIVSITIFLLMLGFAGFQILGLTMAVILMLLAFFMLIAALQFNTTLGQWKKRIRKMESPAERM
jgi:UDP-GlcNAc:undecaprenyl-phosphate/decaprenyl-phosphate GlcNAc-1-phosphate transferase